MDLDAEWIRIKKRVGAIEEALAGTKPGAEAQALPDLAGLVQRIEKIEAFVEQATPVIEQVMVLIQDVSARKAGAASARPTEPPLPSEPAPAEAPAA